MADAKGYIMFSGSNKQDITEVSTEDDVLIQKLKAQGAILIGLTIMVEGGVTPLGYNAMFQGPFNAYNRNYYSGGSSSGSAVAVASGLIPFAIAFDGGGSIRCPATMSGLTGIATTFGRIPFSKHISSVTIAGPLTNNVVDNALIYSIISETEPNHFFTELYGHNGPPKSHLTNLLKTDDLSDVRIGIFKEWFNDSDENVQNLSYEAIDYLKSKGATIIDIKIPHLRSIHMAHGIHIASEFAIGYDKPYYNQTSIGLEPVTRIVVALGSTVTAVELLAADKIRAWGMDYMTKLYDKYNLNAIVTPTMGILPPKLTKEATIIGESNTGLSLKTMKYVSIANLLGLPAISTPIGYLEIDKSDELEYIKDGKYLPVGLHFIGNHWNDHNILRLANTIENGFLNTKNIPTPTYFYDPLIL